MDEFINLKNIIRKIKFAFFFASICNFLSVCCSIIYPYGLKYIFDDVLEKGNGNLLYIILPGMFLSIIFQLILTFIANWVLSKAIQWYLLTKKKNIIDSLIKDEAYIGSMNTTSNIHTLFNSDFEQLGENLVALVSGIQQDSIMIMLYLFALVSLDVRLAIIIIVSIPVVILSNTVIAKYTGRAYLKIKSCMDKVNIDILYLINCIGFIRAFKGQTFVGNKFVPDIEKLNKENVKYSAITTFSSGSISIISVIAPFLVLTVGSFFVIKKTLTMGALLTIFTFAGTIFLPISSLLGEIPTYKEIAVSVDRINSWWNSLKPLYIKPCRVTDYKKGMKISVKKVSVSCNGEKIIKNVTKIFKRGITVIEGKNGVGKSTLVKAIAGIIPYEEGSVVYYNIDHVSYVGNDLYLLPGQIRENLTVGLTSYSEEKLQTFLKLFFFNKELDHIVTNNSKLSTGQIQKIKLIRGLMSPKDEVLILDEVLSNIDRNSRNNIYKYLSKVNDRIIIIIDHNREKSELSEYDLLSM